MSAISNIQSIERYNFSIDKPTQSMDKMLLIRQSEQGLKVFIQERGELQQVDKHLIEGLPKRNFIPQNFFDECHASISRTNHGSKVSFEGRMKGGARTNLYGGDGGHEEQIDFAGRNVIGIQAHFLAHQGFSDGDYHSSPIFLRGMRILYDNNSQDFIGHATNHSLSFDITPGDMIIGMYGKTGNRVDSIGFVIRTANGQEGQTQHVGGPGGAAFNCSLPNNSVATGLIFSVGDDIDAIGMIY